MRKMKLKENGRMALFHIHFFSESLMMAVSVDAILPEPSVAPPPDGFPVLYLLHGLSDDHTIWQRRTSIERYAAAKNLAVVMPNVHRSFYTDMASGQKFFTFVSEELPAAMRGYLPISALRKDNFVAGLSMGGYGAMKLALRCPEKFSYAASLSGALDLASLAQEAEGDFKRELEWILGDLNFVKGSSNDLFALLKTRVNNGDKLPALFCACGTEDFLYEQNTDWKNLCAHLGVPLAYEEMPGVHEWGFWDMTIQHVLAWLPLEGK
jgi:S-formylglutathione hydrolase FrmB